MRAMSMRCNVLVATLIFLPAVSRAQDEVAALLKREIIGGELPLAEVQRYVEHRVPQMRTWETADQWQAEAERVQRR